MWILDILFSSNHNVDKCFTAFIFGLQTLQLIDLSKIYQLKGLEPKNKGHTNFYECFDLTKKVYLMLHTTTYILYLFSKTRATAFLFCSFIEKSRALSLKLFVESPFSLSQKLGSVKSSVSFSFSGEFSFFLLFSCILIHTTQQYFKIELLQPKNKR